MYPEPVLCKDSGHLGSRKVSFFERVSFIQRVLYHRFRGPLWRDGFLSYEGVAKKYNNNFLMAVLL